MSPVFLVAARRSGTTLLRLILNGHPDVLWHHGWEPVADAIQALTGSTQSTTAVKVEGLDFIAANSAKELEAKINENVAQVLCAEKKAIFGATVHIGFCQLPKIWPNARFIHLVRDPRDIAVSNMKLGWAGHEYGSASSWVDAEYEWEKIRPILNEANYIEISYEELVTNPRSEVERLCDFLTIPYNESVFSYTETSTYSYPKKELAHRWKKKLNKREVQLIEYGLNELMKIRGYNPEYEPIELSLTQKILFRQISEMKRRQMAIRDYGVLHILLRKIANISGIESLKKITERNERKKREKRIEDLEKGY